MNDADFDIPADLDTPVSAFLKLGPLDARFLLESVEGGERIGRHSFLGFGDVREVRIGPTRPGDAPDPEAFLAKIRDALAGAPRLAPVPRGLPFAGGLVGAVGYDATRRLERLPRGARRREGEPDALFVAPSSMLVFDHLSRRAALLHSGSEVERRALRREVVRALHGGIPASLPPEPAAELRPGIGRSAFRDAVSSALAAIREGEVFQIVLSIRFVAPYSGDPFRVYRALRRGNPSPYAFYLRFSDTVLVGSSPEALLRLTGRDAELRPIAGTRPRGADPVEDAALEDELRRSAKEGAEHVMLVDLARNDLGRVAVPGTVRVEPSRTVERYSHVMHLVSGVRGILQPGRDAIDLFGACFPAGTVTGAPKVRAMELIDELEPEGRGFYAGCAGYFGHGGSTDQALSIRTIVIRDGEVSIQAGAGIVAESDADHEHEEILAKAAAMRAALTPSEGEA